VTGELNIIRQQWYIDLDPFTTGNIVPMVVLIISGLLAFSLNICALQAYKVTSPITCCIAAAVKQVLMVWIGTAMFHTQITPLNGFGIVIVLFSSTYYSYLSITEPKVLLTNRSHNGSTGSTVTPNKTVVSEMIRHHHHTALNDMNHADTAYQNHMGTTSCDRCHDDVASTGSTAIVLDDPRNTCTIPSMSNDDSYRLSVPQLSSLSLNTNSNNNSSDNHHDDDTIELGVPLIRRLSPPMIQ
jgi:hypothetical protein